MSHEQIRDITSDIYNNFYLKVKDLDQSVESWEERNRLAKEIAAKHDNNPFCHNIIVQYLDTMSDMVRKYIPAPERKDDL